jgi:hypothetical protein
MLITEISRSGNYFAWYVLLSTGRRENASPYLLLLISGIEGKRLKKNGKIAKRLNRFTIHRR